MLLTHVGMALDTILVRVGTAMSEQQTKEKEIVEAFFSGIDENRSEIFDEVVSNDVTTGIYRSGSGQDVTGRDGMKALWTEYWDAFPDLHGVSTDYVQEGHRVAVFRREEGTHEGDFRGIEPTGTSISFEYSGYLDVEDDEIVHAYFHGDILDLLKQLGVESPIPDA